MVVIYSPIFLQFGQQKHPESPDRVKFIYNELKKNSKFKFILPAKAKENDLLLVHSKALIKKIKENSFFDPDTPNIENIYLVASYAVGSAITAANIALEEDFAFSLARPPGHHATKTKPGGFCYFNNIAVACAKLLQRGKRVAILDIDVHHGNGTQDIFLARDGIIYCSLHQSPLFPGTGLLSEKNCFNFPLEIGVSFVTYRKILEAALEKISQFQPDILAISLGFDTYKKDPLAAINLEIADYAIIGRMIRQLQFPTFYVLEGGYSSDIGIIAREFFLAFISG